MERDKVRQNLRESILKLREARGEKQQELAEALGVDRQVVKTWESGTRHIKAPDLCALADHFDCTIDFLVQRSKNPSRDKNIQEICEYTGLSQRSVEALHNYQKDSAREEYIETINALLENEELFCNMASCITRAAEAKTLWRMIRNNGINISDPDYWNEANRVLTVANAVTEEYSPFNFAELPNAQKMPVLLPAGSWFMTADDAAEFLVNRATELFRDIITDHIGKWNVWPDLDFAPGAEGKTQVTVNPDSHKNTDKIQEDGHEQN